MTRYSKTNPCAQVLTQVLAILALCIAALSAQAAQAAPAHWQGDLQPIAASDCSRPEGQVLHSYFSHAFFHVFLLLMQGTLGKRRSIQRGARSLGSGGLRRWFSCKYLDICKKTALHPIPIQAPRIHANKSALP